MTKKRLYLSPPHLGGQEQKYMQDAFKKNWITTSGDNVDAFEEGLCRITASKRAVALSSGTAAIHLALILCDVGPGDEVLCSSFTFVASANPILYLGATPVFVDSESETWNMSPSLLEKAIKDRIAKGKKPKAVVLVHLYGQPSKLKELLAITSQYDIPVVEDAAESLGSTYEGRMTGTFGRLGIYSFNGNKIITSSGGGALISNEGRLIEKAKFLSSQAREDAVHYQHVELGYNYRMSNVLAGIGLGQLEVLNDRVKKKRMLFESYEKGLSGSGKFSFLQEPEKAYSNRWLTTILVHQQSPDFYRGKLEAQNIESRPLWKPLHLQPLYKDAPAYVDGTSETLFQQGLCLPSGTQLNEEDIIHIADIIKYSL